jgi:chloramphenicol O-acetyltransferase type B
VFNINWKRIKSRLTGQPRLQDFARQQEKFAKLYPNYRIGRASYGVPIVHDFNENATLSIGAYTSIASNVQIFLGGNHRIDWVSNYPFPAFFKEANHIKNYSVSRGDVVIGNDVWLCANCTILSGVTIGDGAVIASGAVVSKNVEPYAIMAGNPAQLVRWRFDEPVRIALLASRWWDWPEVEILQLTDKICSDDPIDFLGYAKQRQQL